MTPFEMAWEKTGRAEGGYVDNPHDSGGKTNHGITEVVARAHGWKGDMRELPKERAVEIAKAQFWDVMRLDEIAGLSMSIALELFDTGLNTGTGRAAKFLQEGLNAFNRDHRTPPDYPEIVADGAIGPMTVHTLRTFLEIRGSDGAAVMHRFLNVMQGAFYNELRKARKKDEEFMFGWFLHRVA